MKAFKKIMVFGFLTLLISSLNAQSTDRFVRIIGNAERTFKYENSVINVVITEVAPNDYRQTRYKTIEQVQAEYVAELAKIGVPASSLVVESNLELNQYQKVRSQKYKLTLPKDFPLGKLTDIFVEGVNVKDVKYTYANVGSNLEEELAAEALKDARRKAERLAKEVGKKLGKVLNIEDKSNGCCQEIKETASPTTKLVYKVNITFELID